ncbi:Astacin-like metalloendopeptidase [Strongyloides ratti]|uniref:Metalloendopeptidase n=1 Tax=Strongyloides ratti TaxID=34506 RepID=A0A090MZ36_STRRB|nr:Astacin-like metalloendopeptidase [Strongyloides ratti]CEF68249.2 Astacin-like metalloendopeptidase [Strongyloides ratti]
MINLKKFILHSVIYILYIFPCIISSTNFSSKEEYIKKENVKRSIEEINNLKYYNEKIDEISINNRKKRDMIILQYKWTSPIYYQIGYALKLWLIRKAINYLKKLTCLNFVYVTSSTNHISGIKFVTSFNCRAYLGRKFEKGWQEIGIGNECHNFGGIIRMVLRTLGIIYQHCRIDRDTFIKVFPENIAAGNVEDFQILLQANINQLFLPYEYGSLMHFGTLDGSKNRDYTLMPKDHLYESTVGQQEELTFNDIKTLNFHYCANKCKINITCSNHGYQDPNDCYKCICPDSFEGFKCERYKKLLGCGTSLWTVRKQPTFFKFYGKKNCMYHLKTNGLKKIKIVILKIKIKPLYSFKCSESNSLEIKYWKDKSVMGARFCHQKFPKIIKSHDNYAIIHYNSFCDTSYAQMYFIETF